MVLRPSKKKTIFWKRTGEVTMLAKGSTGGGEVEKSQTRKEGTQLRRRRWLCLLRISKQEKRKESLSLERGERGGGEEMRLTVCRKRFESSALNGRARTQVAQSVAFVDEKGPVASGLQKICRKRKLESKCEEDCGTLGTATGTGESCRPGDGEVRQASF